VLQASEEALAAEIAAALPGSAEVIPCTCVANGPESTSTPLQAARRKCPSDASADAVRAPFRNSADKIELAVCRGFMSDLTSGSNGRSLDRTTGAWAEPVPRHVHCTRREASPITLCF